MSKTCRIHLARLLILFVGATLTINAGADCFPNPSGLIGWWPGDGSAANLLGTNNGTLQGGATASTPGMVGNAFTFDGTNGYVQIPNSPILQPANLTIEAWVKFSSLDSSAGTSASPAGDQYIVFKQNTSSTDFEGFDLSKTRVAGSDYFRFLVASPSGQTALIRSTSTISTGVWYHVAAVRGSNYLQLFVNGNLQRQTNVTFAQSYGTQPLYFGTSGQSSWDHKLKGNLDEVSLFNRALGSNEIAAIYTAGAAGKCKGPSITTQPQSQTAFLGGTASFTVTATGFALTRYQWMFNTVDLPNATNATLSLNNVQYAQAGNYSVRATNIYGVAVSSNATLTVLPPCTATPAGLVSWWRAEGNTTDTGTHPGTTPYGIAYAAGAVGQAFDFDGSSSRRVAVADSPDFKFTNGFTVEAWVYPRQYAGLMIFRGDNRPGLDAWSLDAYQNGNANFQIVDTNGNTANVLAPMALNQWQHLTATWERASQKIKLYVNGSLVTQASTALLPSVDLDPAYDPGIGIGNHSGTFHQFPFNGLIDEPAIYARALGATEIQTIYTSGAAGKCSGPTSPFVFESPTNQTQFAGANPTLTVIAGGTAPLSYRWQFNGQPLTDGVNVSGATNATLTLKNLQPGQAGNYRCVITNASGAVTSAVAFVTVIPPAVLLNVDFGGGTATTKIGLAGIGQGTNDFWNFYDHAGGFRSEGGFVALRTASSNTTPVAINLPGAPGSWGNGSTDVMYEGYVYPTFSPSATPMTITLSGLPAGNYDFYLYASEGNFQIVSGATDYGIRTSLDSTFSNPPSWEEGKQFVHFRDVTVLSSNQPVSITVRPGPSGYAIVSGLQIAGFTPWIWSQPASTNVLTGSSFALQFSAEAAPQPGYQWFRNGSPVANGGRISGATTSTLVITNAQPTDTGNYFAVLSATGGSITSQVAVVQVGTPPVIAQAPASQTNLAGANATFTATASGTAPLAYQWLLNGTPLTDDAHRIGSTTTNLALTNLTLTDAGNYTFIVTNIFGRATSGVAVLTVLLPPSLTQQPQSRTNLAGQSTTFSATATGTAPLNYQWFLNGEALADTGRISGANSSSLNLTNLQLSDAGNYWLVVSNPVAVATSTIAVLTVNPVVCFPPDSGLVGWWQAEGNGHDAANGNFATLSNGVAFSPGEVGQSFSFDGANDFIRIPPSASLNVGTNSGLTIECWINPASVAGQQPLVEWNNPLLTRTDGAHLWISVASAGSLYVNLVDSVLNNHIFSSPAGIVTPNTFQHVAVTYDKASGIATFYYNGAAVATQNIGVFTPLTTHPLYFGHRPYGSGYFYTGLMDEVGLYNRALTPTELQSLYNSSTLGRCATAPVVLQPLPSLSVPVGSNAGFNAVVAGSQPLTYQWYFNNVALTNDAHFNGATSNQLTITATQTNDAGNYRLVVSNSTGASTSTVATVQVGFAPAFTLQPVSQTNLVGNTTAFFAVASGSEPLNYQWYQNTTALTNDARHFGTTTTNLTITNLVVSDAGNYTLRVTNPFGGATSVVAILTIPTPPSITTQPRGFSVPVGMPVTLSAAATGTAPLRYQWVLNSNPVPNATNFSLTISNLLASDFGNYQLVVTNFGGAITSAIAPLTVGNIATWGSLSQAASFPLWPTNGLGNVIAVAAGSSYSMALRPDGTVHLWGGNNQVTNIPPGLSGVVGIAAGPSHALALLSNGLVRAWGLGTSGQTNVPTTLSNVIAIAAGAAHSAALRNDGTVVVWGGTSTEAQTNVPAGLMKVTSIDVGGSQTLALREDGNLIAWGGRIQYPVPSDVKNVAGFSVGPAFSALDLALTSNGLVRAWGGTGTATNVPANINGIIAVEGAGGSDQSTGIALALRSNRTVIGWGGNVGGVSSLTNVPPGVSNVIALAGGLSHVVALIDNGMPLIIRPPIGGTFYTGRDLVLKAKAVGTAPLAFQWFKNGNPIPGATDESLVLTFALTNDAGSYHLVVSNALGIAQSVTVPVTLIDRAPVLMSQPQSRFAYYGSPFSVGVSVIGSGPIDFQWLQNSVPAANGTNDLVFDRAFPQHDGNYQLIVNNPFGSVTSSVAQIKFTRLAAWGTGPSLTNAPVDLGSVLGIASGYFHALAIRSNNTVAAWGTTLNGATNVPSDLTDVVAVTAGSYFSVALKSDGTVVAWGLGTSGQTNVPIGLSNVVTISAGSSHALALRNNGTVAAWGSSSATNVPAGLSNVVAIAAGSTHSLALKNDGTIVGWGAFGKIPNYTNVVALSAGLSQSLALQADGTVLGWGTGVAATSLPAGLSNIVAISAGGGNQGLYHAFALKADGTLVGWGNNGLSQLNWPGELTSAISISAGGSSTLAYLNDRSPVVASQPLNRHAASGTNVTFAALTVGQPALNFQWRLDGNNIPGATNSTLTLTNVTRNSRGYYSALIGNSLGITTSREAWLDVVGPVRLLTTTTGGAGALSFTATDSSGGLLTAEDVAWLEVQASTNLVNWLTVTNGLLFSNGTVIVQDPVQTNYPVRFYRLIER